MYLACCGMIQNALYRSLIRSYFKHHEKYPNFEREVMINLG